MLTGLGERNYQLTALESGDVARRLAPPCLSRSSGSVYPVISNRRGNTTIGKVPVPEITRSPRHHFFQSATRSRIGTPSCMCLLATAFPEDRASATTGGYTRLHYRRSVTCSTYIRIFCIRIF